ncbi:MAG: metallophosphoesterase [Waterburya sp.]
MAGITWLHLSDWHQGFKERDHEQRNKVLDGLIQDIKNRKSVCNELERIDFIVFSGDLAFSGKKNEYDEEAKKFLDKVLEVTELSRDRLFIVPGNHDFDRERKKRYLPDEFRKTFPEDEESITRSSNG